ncbi:MAG: hypothetical protein VKK62_04750 [Synechococcaceae cyanobacterium]|nr:hypothetical protein [Synechococcaceae cyanobacterium]
MEPETFNGAPPAAADQGQSPPEPPLAQASAAGQLQTLFRERFEALLPTIQQQWPEVARHTLESTRGSLDHVVEVISRQTGRTSQGVKQQLLDLLHSTGEQAGHVAETLRPLEEQLENLLDELNSTLRPRIEKPVREQPLLALAAAAGVGLIVGLLLAPGRRSS